MNDDFIRSSNVKIWTTSSGTGTPIILCNGGPGCCDYLEPVANMMDDMAFVIRWEQRGCGRSDKKGPYDLATCILDMDAIRRQYGVDKWIVGGHSWGVEMALAYALHYPQHCLGLIGISGGVVHKNNYWRAQYHRLKEEIGEAEPTYQFPHNMEVNNQIPGIQTMEQVTLKMDQYTLTSDIENQSI